MIGFPVSAADTNALSRPALADLMLASARHVQAVEAGRSLSDCLAATPAVQRPAVQAITFHVMRRLGLATALRGLMVKRIPPDPLFDALLRVALVLLDAAVSNQDNPEPPKADVPRYAVHTIVDQAVRAAQHMPAYKNLLNACLRRFTREHEALLAQALKLDEARWNFPNWWLKAMREAYPDQWQAVLQASDVPGPMTLRVNRRQSSVPDMEAALDAAGMAYRRVGDAGLILARPRPVTEIPGFEQGWWSVQDASAQLAAQWLAPRDGERVLDACAAPGGKTAHLLECADLDLWALDNDAGRLARVSQNLQRLQLPQEKVHLACAEAERLDDWWDGQAFDAVLADVPCTASGVVRRHPDIRWLRRAADIARTAALQQRIVDALWQTVRPGGRMLYATCSVFPQEGELQARRFAEAHADAVRKPASGQLLPLPDEASLASYDGFFYALFVKQT